MAIEKLEVARVRVLTWYAYPGAFRFSSVILSVRELLVGWWGIVLLWRTCSADVESPSVKLLSAHVDPAWSLLQFIVFGEVASLGLSGVPLR
jgi:hypothetical protein